MDIIINGQIIGVKPSAKYIKICEQLEKIKKIYGGNYQITEYIDTTKTKPSQKIIFDVYYICDSDVPSKKDKQMSKILKSLKNKGAVVTFFREADNGIDLSKNRS